MQFYTSTGRVPEAKQRQIEIHLANHLDSLIKERKISKQILCDLAEVNIKYLQAVLEHRVKLTFFALFALSFILEEPISSFFPEEVELIVVHGRTYHIVAP